MQVGRVEQLSEKPDWSFAAVMELDDEQRDRILARAKQLEAESHDDGDDE